MYVPDSLTKRPDWAIDQKNEWGPNNMSYLRNTVVAGTLAAVVGFSTGVVADEADVAFQKGLIPLLDATLKSGQAGGMENINWPDLVFGVGLLELGTRVSWAAVGGILAMVGFWGLRRRVGALESRAAPPVTVNVNPSIRITVDGKDVERPPVVDTQMGGIVATVDDKNHISEPYTVPIIRDGNVRTQMHLARWLQMVYWCRSRR